MKPYDPEKTRMEYHPDDTPECFLPEALTDDILGELAASARTTRERDTLDFIRKHEASQRSVAEGKMTREKQAVLIDRMANEFLRRHGDWVHVANSLYDKFYDAVQGYHKRGRALRR